MILVTLGVVALSGSLQPPPPPLERRSEVLRTLDIPDEIGAAIAPYLRCKIASMGMEVRSSVDGPVERPAAAVGADCSKVRGQAADRAERMLRNLGRGTEAERRALVEQTLTSVDSFVTVPAATPSTQSSSPEE
jgi:hypothetical protein